MLLAGKAFCWPPMAFAVVMAIAVAHRSRAADLGQVERYHVTELTFAGPTLGPADTPARDIELAVTFRHESGEPAIHLLGFWDGDGKGGTRGSVFKVRFCPTREGRWRIVETASNRKELKGQREGETLVCAKSPHPGFWVPDGRWYRRSDGSHPFIVGNTHYTFLSKRNSKGPVRTDPVEDIRGNAQIYKKLRFSLFGGRYPDPKLKPFLDGQGRQTDDGRFALRPNPAWFAQRADPVVREGHAQDLICDLILCGPDTRESRSTLKGDPKPWLRYVAARYGAYPNVWFCLANEWNIKRPSYSAAEIRAAGEALRESLAYPLPISAHSNTGNWDKALNGDWHDHATIQWKLKRLDLAADAAARNFARGGRKPVCNDENAYQGRGDRFSLGDVVEGCFGTFLGGGYPTTGEKYASKLGQYFWGGFDAKKHSASPRLGYLRSYVEKSTAFWRMKPLPVADVFTGAPRQFRLLGWAGREYILGSNQQASGIRARLAEGQWQVTQVDLMGMSTRTVAEKASGSFTFGAPASRAVLTHFRKRDAAP